MTSDNILLIEFIIIIQPILCTLKLVTSDNILLIELIIIIQPTLMYSQASSLPLFT